VYTTPEIPTHKNVGSDGISLCFKQLVRSVYRWHLYLPAAKFYEIKLHTRHAPWVLLLPSKPKRPLAPNDST